MSTKKLKNLGISACLLALACSAGDEMDPQKVIQVDPLEDGTELNPTFMPVRVGHIEIGRSTIDFVKVHTTTDAEIDPPAEDHQESSIIVMQKGFIGEADPVAEVFASSDVPLTTAELYMGLRGDSYLPEALALAHFQEVASLGRTSEFLPSFRKTLPVREPAAEPTEVEKALNLPLQLLDSNFTTAVPGRRWTNVQTGANMFICMGQGCPDPTPPLPAVRSYWACSNRASFETIGYYNLPGSSACTATKAKGWHRVGVVLTMDSSINETATMQGFYGPSTDGQWVSYPSETITRNEYRTWDWNTTASKSMTIAVSRAFSQNSVVRLMTGTSIPN
jgi:hypothetical protein